MIRQKFKFFIYVICLTIIISFNVTFAENSKNVSADKVLTSLLNEYKITFFKQRLTQLVLKDKQIQNDIILKLANSKDDAFDSKNVILAISDYIRTVTTFNNSDPMSYLGEKLNLLVLGLFNRINSIYIQKLEDLNEKIITMVVGTLLKKDNSLVNHLENYLKKQKGLSQVAFVGLLEQLNTALKFQFNSKAEVTTTISQDVLNNFEKYLIEFKKVNVKELDVKNAERLKKYSAKRLWKLISASILNEIADLPSTYERIGKIDINKATVQDLLNIPGITNELASKIIQFRNERGGVITSVHELDAIKGIGPKMVRKLKSVLYAQDFVLPEKEWTVMCFINGDNNLELASMLGINVMERVGSTSNMNVVVQVDRIGLDEFQPEEVRANTTIDGNWTGSRRYFIQKDNRLFELNSILLEKMGEVDMGSYKNFVEFCKWTITRFPAKRYVILISNHGSEFGIGGVSYDDQSKNHMSTIQIGQALSEIRNFIKQQNGNDRIDLMVFDCCLLSKLEVIKEIADYVHGVYACENVQINWYAYDNFLRFLTNNPATNGAELAQVYLKSYVDYMRNWVKQRNLADKMVLTSTAFDMTKFKKFDEAFKQFTVALNNYADTNPGAVYNALSKVKNLHQVTVFDFINFVKILMNEVKDSQELISACQKVLESYGQPSKKVDYNEFNYAPYVETSFIKAEAHNYIEETAHGLSIGIFTKPTWLTIAKSKPELGLNESNVSLFLERFKAGDYKKLKLSQESQWDEFLFKMIDYNN